MSTAKPLKSSFALRSQGGKDHEIAMPPLEEQNTVLPEVPNPWDQQQDQQSNQLFGVPDQLPQDVTNELDQQEEQSPEESVEKVEAVERVVSPKTAQENFKDLRLAKEKAERERDALLAQIMQSAHHKTQAEQPVEEEFDFAIDEDALVEGKYVKKVLNKVKNLESKLERYQNQSQEMSIESKVKAAFPDFEAVVSSDNVAFLNYQYPEVAASLRDTKDLYSQAAAVYKIIKAVGIYKQPFQEDKMKADQNSKKPKPLASVNPQQGDSPLSKANAFANGMTPELQKQLLKEMNEARRRT